MNRLFITVFRSASYSDCTNNGLSSRVDTSTLFFDCTREEAINWCKENGKSPEYMFFLVKRELWGEDHSYAEPLIKPEGKVQVFGGNFLYTSDSRMYKTGGKYKTPLPIHDRFDTQEDYEAMTR